MSEKQTQEEFDQEMAARRASQGITSDDVVPEQRPQAFNQGSGSDVSDLEKARREAGDFDPMPKSAYDKAASKKQLDKSDKEAAKNQVNDIEEGVVVRITKGLYEGSIGTVVGITYDGPDEIAKANSGVPSVRRSAKVASIQIRTRGSATALTDVKPKEVELIPGGFSSTPSAA